MQNENFNPLLKETFVFRPSGFLNVGTVITTNRSIGTSMLRYADGQWIPDDGKPDLAFIQGVFAYGVELPYDSNILWSWQDRDLECGWLPKHLHKQARGWHYYTVNNSNTDDYFWDDFIDGMRKKHPNEIAYRSAMDKCCNINHCANGRGIPLTHEDDIHGKEKITIYIKGSMLPVLPPTNPICYLCLDNGKGHLINALTSHKDELEGDIEYFEKAKGKAELEVYDTENSIEQAKINLAGVKKDIEKIIG